MGNVWVEVALNEVDTDDLIDELDNRHLSNREQELLLSLLETSDAKIKLVLSHIDKFSMNELEEMFNKPFTYPTLYPEGQLSLFF